MKKDSPIFVIVTTIVILIFFTVIIGFTAVLFSKSGNNDKVAIKFEESKQGDSIILKVSLVRVADNTSIQLVTPGGQDAEFLANENDEVILGDEVKLSKGDKVNVGIVLDEDFIGTKIYTIRGHNGTLVKQYSASETNK